jgi:hypothetical protein
MRPAAFREAVIGVTVAWRAEELLAQGYQETGIVWDRSKPERLVPAGGP